MEGAHQAHLPRGRITIEPQNKHPSVLLIHVYTKTYIDITRLPNTRIMESKISFGRGGKPETAFTAISYEYWVLRVGSR